MLRQVMVLTVAALLCGFQAAPRPLPPVLEALTRDAAAARGFDYMAFKAPDEDLRALSEAVYMRPRQEGAEPIRCLTDAEVELQMGLAAAADASDTSAFAADQIAAGDAWAKWRAFADGMMAGQAASEPPFKWVSSRYAQASAETSPRVKALLLRAARDQLYRQAMNGGAQVWGELTSGAQDRVNGMLGRAMCGIDGENTEWLKADVAASGWYLISTSGETASSAAWLMTQHADRDRAFQKQVLAILEPLVASGETSRSNFAYLWDRVAVSENRPQRYGTQGRCTAPNRWEPNEIEDMDRVEALREEAEIGPLSEYQAHMHQYCADFRG